METPVTIPTITPVAVTQSTASKVEHFVLDAVSFLTKFDVSTISSDYQFVMLAVEDVQKIAAALQELEQYKNGTITNTNT